MMAVATTTNDRRLSRRQVLAAGAVGLASTTGLASSAGASIAPHGDWDVNPDDTFQIARLTGPDSINDTGPRWGVYGTDLGSMFEHRGRIYHLFGDTFGEPGLPGQGQWISNTLAWGRTRDPAEGLFFDHMPTDETGTAKELIPKQALPFNTIPTYGVSTGSRMFLHYMDVIEFVGGGDWNLDSSGIAYSDDDGENWTLSEVTWPGDSNFGQACFVKQGQYVYLFGIPGGRHGGIQLARIHRQDMLAQDRYEYWDGTGWVRGDHTAAITLVPGSVGEFSIRWNSYYRKWLLTYLHDVPRPEWGTGAVVIRVADCLVGPWSEERVVVTSLEAPQLYAPFLPPRWNDGPDIYFAMSLFGPYDVFWWHTSLAPEPHGEGRARCVTP
jgi:hypothetical protein